ncbi:MAG: hypothetical protein IJZ24_01735 [Clostridia bacterium]|nr:hypothetical protein [Clostridia bacterium]
MFLAVIVLKIRKYKSLSIFEDFMSEIGIMKGFDKLGRIVIPKELCMRYALNGGAQNIATADGILLKNPEYIPVKQEKTLCRNADKR